MIDFSSLLTNLTKGDGNAFLGAASDPKARQRVRPQAQSLPSQEAFSNLLAGAAQAHASTPQGGGSQGQQPITKVPPPHGSPSQTPISGTIGKERTRVKKAGTPMPDLGYIHGPESDLENAYIYAQPDMPRFAMPDAPVVRGGYIPHFAQGGSLPSGLSLVGDDGPEYIHVDKKKKEVTAIPINPDAFVSPDLKRDAPDNISVTPPNAFVSPDLKQPITTPQQVAQQPVANLGNNAAQYGRPGTQPVAVPRTSSVNDELTPEGLATQRNNLQDVGWASSLTQEQQAKNQREDTMRQRIEHPQTLEDWQAKEQFDADPKNVQKQNFWKDFGTKLILGANAFFNPGHAQPIVGWGEFKRQANLAQDQAQVNRMLAVKDTNLKQQKTEAEIADIPEKREIDRLYKEGLIDQREYTNQLKELTIQNGALTKLFTGKVYDETNPAHQALAKAAGLDPSQMKSWDLTDPKVISIGGKRWKYDHISGYYAPLDELPSDPKEERHPFEVKIPGEDTPRKFNLTDKEASSLAVRMRGMGLSLQARQEGIEAANTRSANKDAISKERLQAQMSNWDEKTYIARKKLVMDQFKDAITETQLAARKQALDDFETAWKAAHQ
jgi:hypothetical protein